ncbi:MAG TPA: glycine cleavage T C-terminal barrel domain-containing protein [Vicinamibacterales bacterium]|nr:glycine cleavage T C-terminal barrel domain-containing protein [Vicinamibacterales bacterium]
MTLQDHDTLIRTGAAIGAIAPRRQIAVAGKDRASYLHGLLTNDVQVLTPGSGCYAAWLTPQGRMLTDMYVLQSDEMILLDVPAETVDATVARLDQFIFTEDVRVESLAETLSAVWVHGPRAAEVVGKASGAGEAGVGVDRAGGAGGVDGAGGAGGVDGAGAVGDLAGWSQYQHARFMFGDAPISIVRIDQIGVPGYCLYLAREHEAALLAALEAAGAVVVLPAAVEAARVEAGYPVFGIDMTDDTIPLEAGIEDRAISMTKGCYVGQEVIVRVLHRGHGRVVRKLVGLRLEQADAVPLRGARLLAGDREIGSITSAARSPRLGVIAMGYVHRDFVGVGTRAEVDTPAGRCAAVITRG